MIIDLEKDLEKYKSKLLVITGDFFLSDQQITKQDKDWLYPQMIKAKCPRCGGEDFLELEQHHVDYSEELEKNKSLKCLRCDFEFVPLSEE